MVFFKLLIVALFIYEGLYIIKYGRLLAVIFNHIQNNSIILFEKEYKSLLQINMDLKFTRGLLSKKMLNSIQDTYLKDQLFRLRYFLKMQIYGIYSAVGFILLVFISNELVHKI